MEYIICLAYKLLNFDGDIWVTERTKSDLILAAKYEDNHKFERFSQDFEVLAGVFDVNLNFDFMKYITIVENLKWSKIQYSFPTWKIWVKTQRLINVA